MKKRIFLLDAAHNSYIEHSLLRIIVTTLWSKLHNIIQKCRLKSAFLNRICFLYDFFCRFFQEKRSASHEDEGQKPACLKKNAFKRSK